MQLNELRRYVEVNKHLPNVPTAQEINSNGLNLSEIQIKQMEKIEEAYLYIFQLQTEINELRSELKKERQKR